MLHLSKMWRELQSKRPMSGGTNGATQTYLWPMPLINTLGMQVGSEKRFVAGYNVLPMWKERLDAGASRLTP